MDKGHRQNLVYGSSFVAPSQLMLDSPAGTPSDAHFQSTTAEQSQDLYSTTLSIASLMAHSIPPKQGGRFNRDAVRFLRVWLSTHETRPYPQPGDVYLLKQQTGLDQKQIMTWFANARRRSQIRDAVSKSTQMDNNRPDPIDIIPRPSTPAVQLGDYDRDPLQRWVESPPEHEPALLGDIARAVATGSSVGGMIADSLRIQTS